MALAPKMKQLIGKATPPRLVDVEKNQIRRFAQAIGEDDPIHFDEEAARVAGFRSLVAPPTFGAAFVDPTALIEEIGWDPLSVMHRSEEYEYYAPICAGDTLSVVHRVADLYEKLSGNSTIYFLIIETRANDARGQPVFKGRRVLVRLIT